ncbi:MCE family protein [Antrihabitans stalactiti]|uniref:MCE family protein n=1 Tax=Antrihabitans stalactiti TaxID=2584121 RepID=A0A848KQJ2_9NOCA|nr:MCE family protein [Antrihabitans stalactiti]NMN97887.1 MCE family protein [Antrihabitans stalactiti]
MTEPQTTGKRSRWVPIALATVVALVLAGGAWWIFQWATTTKITAYFDSGVGIYEGSDVRVLGVPVGEVDSVEPMGDQVKVVMTIDRKYDIPADARAAEIIPSIVADRFIQLTPAYSGGEKMGRTATIPRDRTATPVEVDRLYKSVTELSTALGPNGANKDGVLSKLVETGAANLSGNGQALGDSITQLSRAARYLSDTRGDIFDTIKALQSFVTMLAVNDNQVRTFNAQLADLSGFLAGERQNLGEALNLLSVALGDVARFINDNRALIETNSNSLVTLTQTLADQRDNIAKALPVMPVALSNLVNVHNAESGTLDMRADFPDLQEPFGVICKMLDLGKLKPGDPKFEALGRQLRPILDNCKTITDQITAGVKTPTLILPFGILSNDNQQQAPVPGTVPPIPSPRVPDGTR